MKDICRGREACILTIQPKGKQLKCWDDGMQWEIEGMKGGRERYDRFMCRLAKKEINLFTETWELNATNA